MQKNLLALIVFVRRILQSRLTRLAHKNIEISIELIIIVRLWSLKIICGPNIVLLIISTPMQNKAIWLFRELLIWTSLGGFVSIRIYHLRPFKIPICMLVIIHDGIPHWAVIVLVKHLLLVKIVQILTTFNGTTNCPYLFHLNLDKLFALHKLKHSCFVFGDSISIRLLKSTVHFLFKVLIAGPI